MSKSVNEYQKYDIYRNFQENEVFIIKLRLITELGVERCGSDYNPVVQ